MLNNAFNELGLISIPLPLDYSQNMLIQQEREKKKMIPCDVLHGTTLFFVVRRPMYI